MHSGIGRISRLRMETMTLFELGVSSESVSLETLFNGCSVNTALGSINGTAGIADLLCRGGWPQAVGKTTADAMRISAAYIDGVCESDVSKVDGVKRDSVKVRAFLSSLARYESTHDSLSIAPVYDCGSSLFPEADQTMQKEILHDKQALHRRLYSIPTSSIKINGKRINYFNFLSSLEYVGCNRALERMMPRIDMDKIENIILDTPGIDQAEKEFYTGILKARKENILDYSANQLSREKGAMTLTKELKRTVDRSLAAKEISSTEAAKKYSEVQNSQSGKDEILNEPNVKAADGSHFKGSSDNACL